MPTYNEITLAKELIRFPSITPIDAGVMKFLAKRLTAIGFKCKILEFKDKNSKPVKNLYARLGNIQPNFMFAGHLDVVPPWRHYIQMTSKHKVWLNITQSCI